MKKILCSLLLLSPALFIYACKAEKKPDDRSLLWRIAGNGLTKPSYLFGTIHMICPDDYVWTAAMKQSLAACDKVCFELDMDDPSVLAEATAGLMSTSDKKLKEYFTAEEYARLSRFVLDSVGIDLSMLQTIRPIVLQTLFLTKATNCILPVSYEANIMEEARKSSKEITGLESTQDQLDVFNNIPDDSAVGMVMRIVDSFTESKREFTKMLASYRQQDLPALYEQVKASKDLGEDLGVFLDERNEKWIPGMVLQMTSGPVFFAVGAAHLYGQPGVINLLRLRGYAVTPVH